LAQGVGAHLRVAFTAQRARAFTQTMERFLIKRVGASATAATAAAESPSTRQRFRGCSLPDGWRLHDGSLLVYKSSGSADEAFSKCAVLDFDDTLCRRGSKDGLSVLSLPRDLCFDTVGAVLQRLHNCKFRLVILTNESKLQSLKKQDAIDRALTSKLRRLGSFIEHLAPLPFFVLVATGKDKYRKGEGVLAWEYITSQTTGISVNAAASFMCGDAAGRPKDFSDSDKAFARASGLAFFTPEELFGPEAATALDGLVGATVECRSESHDQEATSGAATEGEGTSASREAAVSEEPDSKRSRCVGTELREATS